MLLLTTKRLPQLDEKSAATASAVDAGWVGSFPRAASMQILLTLEPTVQE